MAQTFTDRVCAPRWTLVVICCLGAVSCAGYQAAVAQPISSQAPAQQGAASATIRLSGGNGSSLASWSPNTIVWDTVPGGTWVLGVASAPTAPLLNRPDATIEAIPPQFIAFGEPAYAGPGPSAKLEVVFADGRALVGLFSVRGANGSGEQWERIDGAPQLSIGWNRDLADRVGPHDSMSPSGTVDNVFRISVAQP